MLDTVTSETWKKHPRYDSISVSSAGRVRRNSTGSIMKGQQQRPGWYVRVAFRHNGKSVNVWVHRAVAETFLGSVAGLDVNHINGIKDDNRVDNLQICTKSENHYHARRVLGVLVGEKNGCAKITDADAARLVERFRAGEALVALAQDFGLSVRGARHIVNGTRRPAAGGGTPTLALALSQIAPQYNAAQHERAAERMMKDMETQYEIRADNPDPAKAGEWAIFATDYNCHARRIACTTNKNEADAMLMGLESSISDLLAACEEALCLEDSNFSTRDCTHEGNRMYAVNPFVLERVVNSARAAIAKARGKGVE